MSAINKATPKLAHQATAIPFRWEKDKVKFCLVTSSAGRWIFPKGVINQNESFSETALMEAHEEAGLHGKIVDDAPLGYYEIDKEGKTLTVVAMLMEVTQVDKDWKESHWRERRWLSAAKANDLLAEDDLRELLDIAVESIKRRCQ